ncbi:MAG: hypothetical protein ACLR6W_10145 [Evtepia sp.]
MRALLYKDLVVNRGKTLPLWGAAGLACLLPAWLPMEGMLLPLVFGLTLPLLLFQQEAKEGWYQLVSQLPFAPRTVVGVRYLEAALLCLWMGACYGLGQALSRPRPGLGPAWPRGAGGGHSAGPRRGPPSPVCLRRGRSSPLLATLGLAAVVSWLALSIDEAAFFGLAGHPLPLLGAGAALFLVSLPVAAGRYARRGW